jgi:hypothetical protein
VAKGMPSITQLYGTARQVARAARAGKPSYIYQFGDHDPSGVLIPKVIERRLKQFCGLPTTDHRAHRPDREADRLEQPAHATDEAQGQQSRPGVRG